MIVCAMLPIFILLQAVRVVAGEYCPYDDSNPYYYNIRYCDYGCCRNKTSSYSEVCCSYNYNNYNTDSSTRSSSQVPSAVGDGLGGLAGLSILIGIIKCCCVAMNSSRKQSGTVEQPANTAMQTFVVDTTALSQGQPVNPVQQGAVGHAYPSAGPPPPYGQHDNVSHKTADLACPPAHDAKY